MNFKEYVTETELDKLSKDTKDTKENKQKESNKTKEDDFSKYTLDELKTLLNHHLKDAKEYKDSDETAYEAALEDIKKIETVIAKLEKSEIKD